MSLPCVADHGGGTRRAAGIAIMAGTVPGKTSGWWGRMTWNGGSQVHQVSCSPDLVVAPSALPVSFEVADRHAWCRLGDVMPG